MTGSAIAHASRAPSLAILASEEKARINSIDQISSINASPGPANRSPKITPRTSAELPPAYNFPVMTPSKEPRKRFPSHDPNMNSPETPLSPHGSLYRAYSLASSKGQGERVGGFPYLSFPVGQVTTVTSFAKSRNSTLSLRKRTDGWRGLLVVMKLAGSPRTSAFILSYKHVQ